MGRRGWSASPRRHLPPATTTAAQILQGGMQLAAQLHGAVQPLTAKYLCEHRGPGSQWMPKAMAAVRRAAAMGWRRTLGIGQAGALPATTSQSFFIKVKRTCGSGRCPPVHVPTDHSDRARRPWKACVERHCALPGTARAHQIQRVVAVSAAVPPQPLLLLQQPRQLPGIVVRTVPAWAIGVLAMAMLAAMQALAAVAAFLIRL